jgi:hypothetical protein
MLKTKSSFCLDTALPYSLKKDHQQSSRSENQSLLRLVRSAMQQLHWVPVQRDETHQVRKSDGCSDPRNTSGILFEKGFGDLYVKCKLHTLVEIKRMANHTCLND